MTTRSLPDDVGYAGVSEDLCVRFVAEAIAVGGELQVVANLAEAREEVRRICLAIGAKSALCWQHELLDRMGISSLLAEASIAQLDHASLESRDETARRAAILAADVGITSCQWAIAETGSLMMWSRPGRERVASLLPPVSISVIERGQILPDLYDAIERLKELGLDGLPSNTVLITGPSKTGDMELEAHHRRAWPRTVDRDCGRRVVVAATRYFTFAGPAYERMISNASASSSSFFTATPKFAPVSGKLAISMPSLAWTT